MTTWAEVQCTQRAYEAVQSASLVDQNPTLDAQTPRNVHYVRGIVNAMKSTRHAIDAFKPVAKGQAAQIGRHTAFILKLSDLEIQLVAWSVLKRIYLACKGIYVRPAVGNVQLLPEPEKHSFDLHLAYVLSILRKSKVVCYQLCERSTWYDRLAMRPGADLNNLNASIESDAGPKPAKYQHGHAAWQKMMGIRPNSSKRRTGKPDPKVIRAALPNVFSKKSRPSKRPSKQGNTKTASKATKQPRTARAQSSRSASVQLHDAAVNQTQTMQPPPHPAPMIPPHPPLAFVPSPEERNQMALAHLPRNQFEQIRVGEHFDNGVAIDPALQVSRIFTSKAKLFPPLFPLQPISEEHLLKYLPHSFIYFLSTRQQAVSRSAITV